MPVHGFYPYHHFASAGADSATSLTTAIVCGASNAKGSYAEIIASTAEDVLGFFVNIASNAFECLVDLAVGAAASERVIVANLSASWRRGAPTYVYIPIFIPQGTRIAARGQNVAATTNTIRVGLDLQTIGSGDAICYQRATTYGADTTDSGCTQIDPGGTINTKGAYAELAASTTNDIRALVAVIGAGQDLARASTYSWMLDIAVGAGGSERVLIPDLKLATDQTSDNVGPNTLGPFFVSIPAGTRLAARAQCSTNTSSDREFDLEIIGFD